MEAPRLTAVVVLPTPPFWFATARTLPMRGSSYAAVRSEAHAVLVRCLTAWSCVRLRRAMKGGSAWAALLRRGRTQKRRHGPVSYGTPFGARRSRGWARNVRIPDA